MSGGNEKRENVSTRNFMVWNNYKDKTPDNALKEIYTYISSFATSVTDWYWKSIKLKRLSSTSIRAFAFLLLACGTVAQFYATTLDNAQCRLDITQAAIALFAIAALMTVADRAFGWSSGWLRYVLTVTTMENLIRAFQLEWAKFFVSKEKDYVFNLSDVNTLFLLAQGLEQELLKLQGDETTKWATEFSAGIAILEAAIKTQREETEKKVDSIRTTLASQEVAVKAQEKAKALGSLELTLGYSSEIRKVQIAFDAEDPVEFLGTSWAKINITPGQHEIRITTVDTPIQTVAKIADIQPSLVTKLEVKFDK